MPPAQLRAPAACFGECLRRTLRPLSLFPTLVISKDSRACRYAHLPASCALPGAAPVSPAAGADVLSFSPAITYADRLLSSRPDAACPEAAAAVWRPDCADALG